MMRGTGRDDELDGTPSREGSEPALDLVVYLTQRNGGGFKILQQTEECTLWISSPTHHAPYNPD